MSIFTALECIELERIDVKRLKEPHSTTKRTNGANETGNTTGRQNKTTQQTDKRLDKRTNALHNKDKG